MPEFTSKGVEFEEAGQVRPRGVNYLLVIAVNEYEHHPKLFNCVRDAKTLVRVLQNRYDFREELSISIYDERATLQNIYKNFTYLSEKVTSDDSVIIFLSGHGCFEKATKTGHFIPVDARQNEVWSYFSNSNLMDRIRSIKSLHTFLIVDSCFSGLLARYKGGEVNRYAEEVEKLPSRWVLASGRLETVEDGPIDGHSPFAKPLLEFLKRNTDSKVPVSKLVNYVKEVTANISEQTPVGGVLYKADDFGGEFVFRLTKPDEEESDWYLAWDLHTIAAFDAYLYKYPEGRYVAEAEKKIFMLEEEEKLWGLADKKNLLYFFQRYLDKYPDGRFSFAAEKKINIVKNQRSSGVISMIEKLPHMIFVKGGAFEMGDSKDEFVHEVFLRDFMIAAYVVTFKEFDVFCEATEREKPSDEGWGRSFRPAIHVSWYDAIHFCNWLSEVENLQPVYAILGNDIIPDWAANGYRLPTEAEWEFASREQGKRVRFGNGKEIADPQEINFDASGSEESDEGYFYEGYFREKTLEVGSFSPNSLGLFDMAGNVFEWCWDWYGGKYHEGGAAHNPFGPSLGDKKILKGGSWYHAPFAARNSYKFQSFPSEKNAYSGFRLARSVDKG